MEHRLAGDTRGNTDPIGEHVGSNLNQQRTRLQLYAARNKSARSQRSAAPINRRPRKRAVPAEGLAELLGIGQPWGRPISQSTPRCRCEKGTDKRVGLAQERTLAVLLVAPGGKANLVFNENGSSQNGYGLKDWSLWLEAQGLCDGGRVLKLKVQNKHLRPGLESV